MSLQACQLDPRRDRGTFTVTACTPRPDGRYDLLLADSLLYAEGGGQPADHGTVGGVQVVDVQPTAEGLRHLALGPVAPGPAEVVVDWDRRFDHMQQHTAQHLVTAVAQDRLGLATVGFHLGEGVSTIDLDGPLSDRDRDRLAAWVNAEIRADRPVRHRTVDAEEYAALRIRSRGLPDGHEGPIRVVAIDGLDENTCGGTHVARLGELQAVHFPRSDRHKGGTRLSFLAGGRVLSALDAARDREQALTRLLTCGAEEQVASVGRLLDQARDRAKAVEQRERELAELLGRALARSAPDPDGVRRFHRDEGDMALLQKVAQAAAEGGEDLRLVLSAGETEGVFLVLGDEAWVAQAGPAAAAAAQGRGGGRGGRFQGKGSDMAGLRALALGPG